MSKPPFLALCDATGFSGSVCEQWYYTEMRLKRFLRKWISWARKHERRMSTLINASIMTEVSLYVKAQFLKSRRSLKTENFSSGLLLCCDLHFVFIGEQKKKSSHFFFIISSPLRDLSLNLTQPRLRSRSIVWERLHNALREMLTRTKHHTCNLRKGL